MSALKNYFIEQTKWNMLGVENTEPSKFYLSAWQNTTSAVPLLIIRIFLFLLALGIVTGSATLYYLDDLLGYWFIYLTHWGLLSYSLCTGFAVLISAKVYIFGPISAELALPWYVRVYWVLYNIANPIAFLITIFYWTLLYDGKWGGVLNFGLDLAVHALNSVVMLLTLLTAGHPSRLLHFHHPVIFALTWTFFSVVYYFAGGKNSNGKPFVYSMVNWSRPGLATIVVVLTGALLVGLHLLVLGLGALRDFVAAKYCHNGRSSAQPNVELET